MERLSLSHIRLRRNPSIVMLIKPCPEVTFNLSSVSLLIYPRQQDADIHEKINSKRKEEEE